MTIKREKPFFGSFGNFSEAFPEVETLELKIEREERHVDGRLGCDWSKHVYSEQNVPDQLACSSGLCERGGFDIQALLSRLKSKRMDGMSEVEMSEQLFHCAGDFGSPQGKRIGKPCSITFKVVLAKMIFKPNT